jgi:uncharacterized membrane protein
MYSKNQWREIKMAESKVKHEDSGVHIPVHTREKAKNGTSAPLTDRVNELIGQERFWATLAHAMGPIMIAMLIFGDGANWLGLMLITGGIYLYFSNKSDHIKFHARQALAAQILGTFGWVALLIGGTIAWVGMLIVSILLILVLIGLVLTPLVALGYPMFLIASFLLPLGVAIFGTKGAWEAWHGRDYRYPKLADWLDKRFGDPMATPEIITV